MKFDTDQIKENLDDVFENGKERISSLAEYLDDRIRSEARSFAKQAQRRWKRGRKQLSSTNDAVVGTVKEHPVISSAALAVVIGLVVTWLVVGCRCCQRSDESDD